MMRKPICTIVIECSPDLVFNREEWGQFRMDLAHHINRMQGCDVKYFGWKDPSPEIYEADVIPIRPEESDD